MAAYTNVALGGWSAFDKNVAMSLIPPISIPLRLTSGGVVLDPAFAATYLTIIDGAVKNEPSIGIHQYPTFLHKNLNWC
jgi:hypothetical protein